MSAVTQLGVLHHTCGEYVTLLALGLNIEKLLRTATSPYFAVAVSANFLYVSLSRLNHGQPGVQAYPEVVQGTAELHHEITDPLLPQTDAVFHNATALHATVHMLNPQATLVQRLVRPLLLPRELLATRFLGRHEDHHLRECERQEPQILQKS